MLFNVLSYIGEHLDVFAIALALGRISAQKEMAPHLF